MFSNRLDINYPVDSFAGVDSEYTIVDKLWDYADSIGVPTPNKTDYKFLIELDAIGFFEYCDIFYLFAGYGSANFKRINIANMGVATCTFYSTSRLSSLGFQGGTNYYVNTFFNPATMGVKYKLNDAHRMLFNQFGSSGVYDGGQGSFENSWQNLSSSGHYMNSGTSGFSGGLIDMRKTGLHAFNRISNTAVEFFLNGVKYSRTSNSTAIKSANQFVLRSNNNYGSARISLYSMGAAIPESIYFQVKDIIATIPFIY